MEGRPLSDQRDGGDGSAIMLGEVAVVNLQQCAPAGEAEVGRCFVYSNGSWTKWWISVCLGSYCGRVQIPNHHLGRIVNDFKNELRVLGCGVLNVRVLGMWKAFYT